MQHRILTIDPGTRNFAFCAAKYKHRAITITKLGLFKTTILKPEAIQITAFYSAFTSLCEEIKPTRIVVERFQGRGLRGTLGECVCLMIGVIATIACAQNIDIYFVSASQWKQKIKTNQVSHEMLYKQRGSSHHKVDVLGLLAWTLNRDFLSTVQNWRFLKASSPNFDGEYHVFMPIQRLKIQQSVPCVRMPGKSKKPTKTS